MTAYFKINKLGLSKEIVVTTVQNETERKKKADSVVSIRVLTQHAPGPEFHHRVRKERKKEKKKPT